LVGVLSGYPLIAEHLIVPQVVHTVAVGTERWALALGVT